MYCTKCGTKLPDQANFCFNCCEPTANSKSSTVGTITQQKECLKIEQRIVQRGPTSAGSDSMKFLAIAGDRVIDETESFNLLRNYDKGLKLMSEMVARLQADGWEVRTADPSGRIKTMGR